MQSLQKKSDGKRERSRGEEKWPSLKMSGLGGARNNIMLPGFDLKVAGEREMMLRYRWG